jgi:hypothetical protein
MLETKQNKWGSFLCWLAGHHIGNVQWGEYDKDDIKHRKITHKCADQCFNVHGCSKRYHSELGSERRP